MFEAFYHLDADPFRLTPNPKFSFQHHSYKKAWAYLLYALKQAEGFVIVTGRSGTGKTTLIEAFQRQLSQSRVVAAKITSTNLEATDLLRAIAHAYDINVDGLDKATLLLRIEQFLLKQLHSGKRVLLIIDEAQGLRYSSLEELRLLADLHTDMHPLLQVFLVGQEELQSVMSATDMEQFQQRVIGTCHLETMDLDETRVYIQHRLQCSGWRGEPQMTGQAVVNIYRYSNGVPRHVNKICSRLLLYGRLEHKHKLDKEDVLAVVEELRSEQLAPLVHDRPIFEQAQDEDKARESEREQASLNIDDLAIRSANRPRQTPVNSATKENTVNKTHDQISTRLPKSDIVRHKPRAVHHPTFTSRVNTKASAWSKTLHQCLHQLVNQTAGIYRNAVKIGTLVLQKMQHRLISLWDWIRTTHLTERLNWQVELALVIGLLVVVTVAMTDWSMLSHQDGSVYDSQTITESDPEPVPVTVTDNNESIASAESMEHIEKASPMKAVDEPTVALPVETTKNDPVSPDADAIEPFKNSSLETASLPVSMDSITTIDQNQDTNHKHPVPDHSNRLSLATEMIEFPPVKSEDTGNSSYEFPFDQPQDIMDIDTEEEARANAVIVSKESVIPEIQEQIQVQEQEHEQIQEQALVVESVQTKIAILLRQGRKSYRSDRLLFPESNSAFSYFQQVLKLEPENPDAREGIRQIVLRYLALARSAMARNDEEKANRYLARGLRVQPDNHLLVALQNKLVAPPFIEDTDSPSTLPDVVQLTSVESEPTSKGGFFSRIKTFFTANQVSSDDEMSTWENGNNE